MHNDDLFNYLLRQDVEIAFEIARSRQHIFEQLSQNHVHVLVLLALELIKDD